MSSRFCFVSWARRRRRWTYSRSCFNTVNDGLNFLQVAVNARLGFAPLRALAHNVLVDGLDFAEASVNPGQVVRVLFAQAIGGGGFRCHGNIVAAQAADATGHFWHLAGYRTERDRGSFYWTPLSFVPEQFALQQFVNEAADAVMAGAGAFQDLLDRFAVGEMDRRAGGIDRQLPRQVAGELFFVREQELFQLENVAEFPAVGKFTAGVHGQRVVEREFLSAFGDAPRQFAFGLRTIAVAPAAHHIKVLQREPRRINLGVAGVAGFQGAMFVELLADGHRAANVRIDGRHTRRLGRRFLAEDALHDPRAAHHR